MNRIIFQPDGTRMYPIFPGPARLYEVFVSFFLDFLHIVQLKKEKEVSRNALKQLRKTAVVGDVVSPIEEE
ncbi:MAG: hypothetical protein KJP23_22430, partial [Deltaproteobacteria bacterium]|nr:hypothetical protein [Deltaproteobacteria bacterium]